MFSGGLIAAALCSGGTSYQTMSPTFTQNGVYTSASNVRWDKVTVDIPIGTSICEAITKLPVKWGGSLGKSYHYYVHIGDVGSGAYTRIGSYPDYEPWALYMTK